VRAVVLALDGDQGGHEASSKLADEFQQAGLTVQRCLVPQDRWGKDWNERWRTIGSESVQPLIETYRALRITTRSA
jgi:DNA primase